jgi:hypothetical protein
MGPLALVIFLLAGEFLLAQEVDQPPQPDPQTNPQATTPQAATPNDSPTPITGIGRLDWAVKSTIGPASLEIGVLSASWGTGFDHPKEYGVSFDGFVKRYGLRLTGVATSNVAEASLGVIWAEDPRYHPDYQEQRFGKRFGRTLKMTFMSNRKGELIPAYARFIAIAGTNVLSDSWRPNSDRGPVNTIDRIGLGFGGRLLGNMYEEFWPDVKKHVFFLNKH